MAPQPPSLVEKILIIPILAEVLVAALSRLILHPITGGPKALTLLLDVGFAAIRENLANVNVKQEQWLAPSTEQVYLSVAKARRFQPDTTVLASGNVKLHWLGSNTNEQILLYYHGGGYVLPAMDAHVKTLFYLQEALNKNGKAFTVVLVSYTLAPESQYPNQLIEAVEALEHLIVTRGKKPGNIIVGGDSAGGNMTLLLLSHLLHPHKAVKSTSAAGMASPLAGALLISPWAIFGTEYESARTNAKSDMVSSIAAKRWSSAFLGSSPTDAYNEPGVKADSDWFKGLSSKVEKIFVWGGGGEVLIDSIDIITNKLKDAHPNVEYAVQAGAGHEQPVLDVLFGYKEEKSEGMLAIKDWLQQTFV